MGDIHIPNHNWCMNQDCLLARRDQKTNFLSGIEPAMLNFADRTVNNQSITPPRQWTCPMRRPGRSAPWPWWCAGRIRRWCPGCRWPWRCPGARSDGWGRRTNFCWPTSPAQGWILWEICGFSKNRWWNTELNQRCLQNSIFPKGIEPGCSQLRRPEPDHENTIFFSYKGPLLLIQFSRARRLSTVLNSDIRFSILSRKSDFMK